MMQPIIPDELKQFIKENFKGKNVACLTGAGISVESGVPAFRGEGGLWEKYDPEIFANTAGLISLLRKDQQRLIDFVTDFYSALLEAKPNPAHFALCVLEKADIVNAIITQNIDNLHQRAGSRGVIELHGNAFRIRCMRCQRTFIFERDRIKEMVDSLKESKGSRIKLFRVLSRYFPRCACGSRYRIDIVLFGEMLPQDELTRAYQQLDNCKVLLLIGSSLAVYPAASLPLYAKEKGAKLIEINDQPTALSDLCDYKIIGRAGEVLPQMLGILEGR